MAYYEDRRWYGLIGVTTRHPGWLQVDLVQGIPGFGCGAVAEC